MPQTEKMISWILKGGLFATPFLVFIVTRSLYFPFITGKNFAFRILVELLAVVWVWAALKFPGFRLRSSPLALAVTVFIAVMGLATVFSLSPYHSFWSSFERMEGYIGLLHLFLYFLLLTSVFRTQRDWSVFFNTSLAASIIVSFYALLQLSGQFTIHQGGTRVDATFGNATYLAAYLLFHIFFLAWFFLRTENRWLRLAYGAAAVLEAAILYFTATRGAILGLLGGALVFAVILAIVRRGTLRRWALGAIGVIVLLPLLFFFVKDTAFVQRSEILVRFASISPQETTTQARFTIWQMALGGWRERPILGWGQESFVYVFSKYYEPSLWRQEPWFDRAHNVFLDWLTAGGVLGLASYLAMFAAAGWLLLRAVRARTLDAVSFSVLAALLAAHFFQILFVFDNLTSYLLFFAVLGYVHTVSQAPLLADVSAGGNRRRKSGGRTYSFGLPAAAVERTVAVLGLVVFVLIGYLANVRPIRAARSIIQGLQTVQRPEAAGKVDALTDIFRRGIALNTFGTAEIREQVSQTSNLVLRDPAIAVQDKSKYFEFAIQEMENQRSAFPSDIRAKTFLTVLYTAAGRSADAVRVADEAIEVSPRRPQFYFIAAEARLGAGQADQAIALLRRAYELAPDYPDTVTNLIVTLIITGREEEAETLSAKHLGTPLPVGERFAEAYLQAGQMKKAAAIWERVVEASPADARSRAALGVAYARSGRPEEGIRELEKAIELEPRFKADGERIIADIRAGKIR